MRIQWTFFILLICAIPSYFLSCLNPITPHLLYLLLKSLCLFYISIWIRKLIRWLVSLVLSLYFLLIIDPRLNLFGHLLTALITNRTRITDTNLILHRLILKVYNRRRHRTHFLLHLLLLRNLTHLHVPASLPGIFGAPLRIIPRVQFRLATKLHRIDIDNRLLICLNWCLLIARILHVSLIFIGRYLPLIVL